MTRFQYSMFFFFFSSLLVRNFRFGFLRLLIAFLLLLVFLFLGLLLRYLILLFRLTSLLLLPELLQLPGGLFTKILGLASGRSFLEDIPLPAVAASSASFRIRPWIATWATPNYNIYTLLQLYVIVFFEKKINVFPRERMCPMSYRYQVI